MKNGVGGRLDSGNEVRRRESDLLDLGEVVLGVLVQGKLSDRAERELEKSRNVRAVLKTARR